MGSLEEPFLDEVVSVQRFNWGKPRRLAREQALSLGRVVFRSSVPSRLRPVQFAPVDIFWNGGLIKHDELGILYDCLLQLSVRIEDSRDIKRQPAAIDSSGLVYKELLPGNIAVGHEYGYFPDPAAAWREWLAMSLLLKGRRQHKSYEKKGYTPGWKFMRQNLNWQPTSPIIKLDEQ